MTSASPQDTLRADISEMLRELAPLIREAADVADFRELNTLLERRDALLKLLEHLPRD